MDQSHMNAMKRIPVFFAINDAYAQHCCVTIASILNTTPHRFFEFYIMTDAIGVENREKIQSLKNTFDNFKLEFLIIDNKPFEHLKLNINYISIQTYYRYIIAALKPDLDKALYLDCDLVVNGDLSPYFDTDLTGYYCAGAYDSYIADKGFKKDIGLGEGDLYINAGSVLFNLDKIRQDNIIPELFENTQKLKDVIKFQDQDILNYTFKGKIKEVDIIYNFTSRDMRKYPKKCSKAVVIHYTGEGKPWLSYTKNPMKNLYLKNLKLTAYKDRSSKIKKAQFLYNFRFFFKNKSQK
ncbi:MAG: glycosyltransferase family 8 protein [Lactobacillales bacterium]|jgi:lipopolysaccharide biosynthesis glycosyltransferase|nr:glycosyltransferase family 8 protein [Lactobacillales bacterium]